MPAERRGQNNILANVKYVNEQWQTALDIVKRFRAKGDRNLAKTIIVKSWPGPFSMYKGEFTWGAMMLGNYFWTTCKYVASLPDPVKDFGTKPKCLPLCRFQT